MYYSAIGILALLVLVIENQDILLHRGGDNSTASRKVYRMFLYSVIVYYVTDIIWGMLEAAKLSAALFADTTVYFVAMAAGILFWTRHTVVYAEEEDTIQGKILTWIGRVFAAAIAVFVLINIFTPLLFTVDAACVYTPLWFRYVILALQIVTLMVISVYAFTSIIRRNVPAEKKKRYLTLGLFGLVMAVFLTIQIWYPYLPLYTIAYMLGTCLLRAFFVGEEKGEYRTRLIRMAEERLREEQIAYARLNVLTGDFLSIHVVDPVTGHYREFSVSDEYESFELPTEGKDFFGVAREEGRKLVCPEDLDRYLSLFSKEGVLDQIQKNGIFSLSYRLMVYGKPMHVQFKAAMTEEEKEQRIIAGIINVDSHVRQEAEYERRLAQVQAQARVDALTGVRNMHGYMETEEKLNRRIDGGDRPEFAIAVLDVNNLKKVNDEHGHQAGDEYLRRACRVICDTFKHSAVFRVGGDEFAVISMGEDYRNIERLIGQIAKHNADTASDGVVIACGMSRFDGDGSVAAVFERADHAMYENKSKLKAVNGQ